MNTTGAGDIMKSVQKNNFWLMGSDYVSEQGMKVHLACDELNRTGQTAPANHGAELELVGIIRQSSDPAEAIRIATLTILQVLNFA